MIIDIHTHTFPDRLADKAIAKLSESANMASYLNGTLNALKKSMEQFQIEISVLLPVVTKPSQQEDINTSAILLQEQAFETGIWSFGGIHPENENYKDILNRLSAGGVKGIKIHPVFQNTYLDDIKYLRIISYASELNMAVMVHGGYDISFPTLDFATPIHALSVINQVHPTKLILAHMGGWNCWNDVERFLVGQHVYLDTSFSLNPIYPLKGSKEGIKHQMDPIQFCNIVRNHGEDKILFGTDSPWTNQLETLKLIKESGLSEEEYTPILAKNSANILAINNVM